MVFASIIEPCSNRKPMNNLPIPSIESILQAHAPVIQQAVIRFIQSNNESLGDDVPGIVQDQCFVSQSEPGKAGFVLLHSTGLYGVMAKVHDDGSLSELSCRSL